MQAYPPGDILPVNLTSMKEIKFRVLRRVKKSGKIVVASYSQWRKVKTCDFGQDFRLVIDSAYKSFDENERVYNHQGENLFWYHYDPEQIPFREENPDSDYWRTYYDMYCIPGTDVDGVPTFSHKTAENVVNGMNDVRDLEPLTVGHVKYWFGWFLYRLDNCEMVWT